MNSPRCHVLRTRWQASAVPRLEGWRHRKLQSVHFRGSESDRCLLCISWQFSALVEQIERTLNRERYISSRFKMDRNVIPTIHIEIVIWHVLAKWNGCTTIVSQMKDPGFNTQPWGRMWICLQASTSWLNWSLPAQIPCQSNWYMSIKKLDSNIIVEISSV